VYEKLLKPRQSFRVTLYLLNSTECKVTDSSRLRMQCGKADSWKVSVTR